MTVYLTVWYEFDGKQIGVLEIRNVVENNGSVRKTYEFIGAGASDGGIWEWVAGSKTVEAHLTSNIRKSKVAVMRSGRWANNNPPQEPWLHGRRPTRPHHCR